MVSEVKLGSYQLIKARTLEIDLLDLLISAVLQKVVLNSFVEQL